MTTRSTQSGHPRMNRVLTATAFGGAAVVLSACPNTQIQTADIEIFAPSYGVLFSDSPVAPNRVAFQHAYGSGALALAPGYALPLDGTPLAKSSPVELRYTNSDALPGFDRIDVLLFDRDPDEHLAALSAIVGYSDAWADVSTTPPAFDSTFSLPDAYVVAYPPTNITGTISPTTPIEVPIATDDFGGENITPLSDAWRPAGTGSVKGLYVMPRGTCSQEAALLPILQTVERLLGPNIASQIADHTIDLPTPLTNVALGSFSVTTVGSQLESYVHATGSGIPGGGFVADIEETTVLDNDAIADFVCARATELLVYPPAYLLVCAAAAVAANALVDIHTEYNFQSEFNHDGGPIPGILSLTTTVNGANASGTSGGTIKDQIVQQLPSSLPKQLSQAAEDMQAQPFPVGGAGKECAGASAGNPVPSTCYSVCNLRDYPGALPDPSSDPYAPFVNDLCGVLVPVLDLAIASGVDALSIPQQYAGSIAASLTGTHAAPDASGRQLFNGLRCNFKPDYVQKNVPVCEVMALASRVNVFPDAVELVFFDADPSTVPKLSDFSNNTDLTLYSGNPGFGLFVALNQTAQSGGTSASELCAIHQPADAEFGTPPTYTRRYAHAP